MDYYELLGVPRDATEKEIARAYRRQALKFHPDINPDPDSEQFHRVTQAYETLSDAGLRAYYDLHGVPKPQHDQQQAVEDLICELFFKHLQCDGDVVVALRTELSRRARAAYEEMDSMAAHISNLKRRLAALQGGEPQFLELLQAALEREIGKAQQQLSDLENYLSVVNAAEEATDGMTCLDRSKLLRRR